MPYRFQLQMPPDRHGQTWILASKAWASSGLAWRRASLVLVEPCVVSARTTLVLRTVIVGSALASALAFSPALPWSVLTSSGPGVNPVAVAISP